MNKTHTIKLIDCAELDRTGYAPCFRQRGYLASEGDAQGLEPTVTAAWLGDDDDAIDWDRPFLVTHFSLGDITDNSTVTWE